MGDPEVFGLDHLRIRVDIHAVMRLSEKKSLESVIGRAEEQYEIQVIRTDQADINWSPVKLHM